MRDEWEDIAFGPPAPSNADEWQDVAFGPAVEDDRGIITRAWDWFTTRPDGTRPPIRDQVAGPLIAAADALTLGLGDELIAAGVAATGPQTYGEALEDVRGIERRFRDADPVVSTALDIAGAVRMPIQSTVKRSDSLGRAIAKLGAEGAAFGGAAAFGEGEGGFMNRLDVVDEGAIAGGALSAGLGGAIRATPAVASKASDLLDVARSPERRAAEILVDAAGDDLARIVPDADDPFYRTRTLAEETQNPRLAQLQQTIGKRNALANELDVQNVRDRRAVQEQLLSEISEAPPRQRDEAGVRLREMIEAPAADALKAAEEIFSTINPNAPVPFARLRSSITRDAKKTWEAGGMPRDIRGILEEINRYETVKLPNGQVARQFPKAQRFSYMHALRQRAQQAWNDARVANDRKAQAFANQIVRRIDEAIDEAGKVGSMDQADVDAFKAGKAAFSDYMRRFGEGNIGRIRTRIRDQQYQMGDSVVMGSAFTGKAEDTRKLLEALPDSAEALDEARGLVRDQILRLTRNRDGTLSPAAFRRLLQERREGLTAAVGDKRLMEPEHLKALDRVAEDLALMDPQSERSVARLAQSASRGQPTTAQALFMESAAQRAVQRSPGGWFILNWINAWRANRADAIDETLARALYDKDFALNLASKATESSIKRAISALSLDGAGARLASEVPQFFGRVVGAENARQAADTDLRDNTARAARARVPTPSSAARRSGDRLLPGYTKGVPSVEDDTRGGSIQSGDPVTDLIRSVVDGGSADSLISDVFGDATPYRRIAERLAPAVIQQESGGRADAVSEVGAQGLMQLMPETGRELARRAGVEYDPFDPVQNRMLGTMYLESLLRRFGGDPELALTAYHSGQGRVARALAESGGRTLDDILPALGPIGRRYARQVLSRLEGDALNQGSPQ